MDGANPLTEPEWCFSECLLPGKGVSDQSFYHWRKRLTGNAPVRFALVEANAWIGKDTRSGVIQQETAGRLADKRYFRNIDVIGCGVRFHPLNRCIDIGHRLRKLSGRSKPVIDTEPGKPSVGQRLKQRSDVRTITALVETTSVNKNSGRKRTRSARNMRSSNNGFPL